MPFSRAAFDLRVVVAQPASSFVDRLAIRRLECEVMQPECVAVDRRLIGLGGALSKSQGAAQIRSPEIVDRLTALTFLFDEPNPPERAEQFAVEGKAAFDRGNDQVDVIDKGHQRNAS